MYSKAVSKAKAQWPYGMAIWDAMSMLKIRSCCRQNIANVTEAVMPEGLQMTNVTIDFSSLYYKVIFAVIYHMTSYHKVLLSVFHMTVNILSYLLRSCIIEPVTVRDKFSSAMSTYF